MLCLVCVHSSLSEREGVCGFGPMTSVSTCYVPLREMRDVKFNQVFTNSVQRQQWRGLEGWMRTPLQGRKWLTEYGGCSSAVCVCDMQSEVPTVWNLHLSVANQLTGQEGFCVSVLNESVLHHLHHAQSRLQGKQIIKNIKKISSLEIFNYTCAI